MSDIVCTVPLNFRYGDKKGLAAWLDEGDAPGTEWEDGDYYVYTTGGARPKIEPGERCYIVCEGMLVGYAPLVEMRWTPKHKGSRWGTLELIRGGGAVACTLKEQMVVGAARATVEVIPRKIVGFRGWRYRWWKYEEEIPLDLTPWLPKSRKRKRLAPGMAMLRVTDGPVPILLRVVPSRERHQRHEPRCVQEVRHHEQAKYARRADRAADVLW